MSSPLRDPDALARVLRHPAVWRGRAPALETGPVLATGEPALDRVLPGGGWPLGGLTELLHGGDGMGELGPLMPALASLTRAGHLGVWVAPPHIPYAPALAGAGLVLSRLLWVAPVTPEDALWAAEQALAEARGGAVLVWADDAGDRALRRLQLAAEKGGAFGVVLRHARHGAQPSPAVLRAEVVTGAGGPALRILKCRGPLPATPVVLARH